jgi:hypothetical protein
MEQLDVSGVVQLQSLGPRRLGKWAGDMLPGLSQESHQGAQGSRK